MMKEKILLIVIVSILFFSGCRLIHDESLYIYLPTSVTEGTPNSNDGMIYLETSTNMDLIVELDISAAGQGRLDIPGYVIISANSTSQTFDVQAVDNGDVDVDVSVTVTASALGYDEDSDTITVVDND